MLGLEPRSSECKTNHLTCYTIALAPQEEKFLTNIPVFFFFFFADVTDFYLLYLMNSQEQKKMKEETGHVASVRLGAC